jgi:ribosomal protein S18 acetylase RimI-like enzyme
MSDLRPKSLDAILEWWAQELGISGADLWSTQPGVTLSGNPLLPGIFAFRRGGFVRIAASPGKLERIRDAIVDRRVSQIFTPEFWRKHTKDLAGLVVGPAVLYYTDRAHEDWKGFAPPMGFAVRGLAAMDAGVFAEFANSLSAEDRECSGLEFGPQPMWGLFTQKRLVAVAGYDAWPGKVSHVCVGVHPNFRGKGFGRLAVLAAAKGALARRRIIQFRTLADNDAAIGLAKSLGFELFAETIYVRPPSAQEVAASMKLRLPT